MARVSTRPGDFLLICDPKEGRLCVSNDDRKRTNACRAVFTLALELATSDLTRKEFANDTLPFLSQIDRAFINISMAEARDFRCRSHVVGRLSVPAEAARCSHILTEERCEKYTLKKHIVA